MAIDTPARMPATFKVPVEPIWQLRIEQYHQMIRTGILTDDDPVELLEGWLVTKMPKNPSHRLTTQLTCEALSGLIPAGYYVDDQEPLTTDESEPEPDVMIVRGHRRDYRDRHPGPADSPECRRRSRAQGRFRSPENAQTSTGEWRRHCHGTSHRDARNPR